MAASTTRSATMPSTARGEPRMRESRITKTGTTKDTKGTKEEKTKGRAANRPTLLWRGLPTTPSESGTVRRPFHNASPFNFFLCVFRILRALRVLCGYSSWQLFVAASCSSAACLARQARKRQGRHDPWLHANTSRLAPCRRRSLKRPKLNFGRSPTDFGKTLRK